MSRTMMRARLLAELNGQPWLTRKQRREKEAREQQERETAERIALRVQERSAVAAFIRQDDASRHRAIRLSAGSAYGVNRRAVTFRLGK